MRKEKQKILTLIDTLEKTIESQERRVTMLTKEKFNGFTYQDNQKYKQAAIDMYGKEAIEEAIEKQKGKEKELMVSMKYSLLFLRIYLKGLRLHL